MKIKVKSKGMLKNAVAVSTGRLHDEKNKPVSPQVINPKKSSALFGKNPNPLVGVKPTHNIPKSLTK